MKVKIMSEDECVLYTKQENILPCVIISINTHGGEGYKKNALILTNNNNVKDVLTLFFDDITERNVALGSKCKLMSEEDVSSILTFVEEWRGKIDEFIVHCGAGISRSPAVASGISIMLGLDDTWIWESHKSPNKYVFEKIRNAIGLSMNEVRRRYSMNEDYHKNNEWDKDIVGMFLN